MRCLFIFLVALLLNSCGNQDIRQIKEFPRHEKLSAYKKKINELIKPVDLVIHGDFLIIQTEPMADLPCFYVYRLDSLSFLYSFGKLGGGEEEYVSPTICHSGERSLFSVFDQRRRDIKNYLISSQGATLQNSHFLNEPTGFPIQESSFLNDSIFLYLTVDNHVVSYHVNRNTTIDSISFETDIEKTLGEDYNQSLAFFSFARHKNRIVTGHEFIDHLATNNCDADGYFRESVLPIQDKVPPLQPELKDNVFQYVYTYATSDLIFAQYCGYLFKTLQPFPLHLGKRHMDFVMEVYDWDLNPKALLEFDSDIMRCVVDERDRRIITWDPLSDFDNLLVYHYDTI